MSGVTYIHLPPGSSPPTVSWPTPFRTVVVIEEDVTRDWRKLVSEWLVEAGCFYMMAWGKDCSLWDDSVDWASIEASGFDITDDNLVMTTWHDEESLDSTLWYSAHCAFHGDIELKHTVIIDIATLNRREERLSAYKRARISEGD